MSDSTVIFLRNGVVSVIIGLSVLSLPLLLRDEASDENDAARKTEKLAAKVSGDVDPDGSDIIKELETAFPSRKAVRTKSGYSPAGESYAEPDDNAAIPQLADKAAPALVEPKASTSIKVRQELSSVPAQFFEPAYAPPVPDNNVAIPQFANKAAPALVEPKANTAIKARQEASVSEGGPDRVRKASLNDSYSAKPLPAPSASIYSARPLPAPPVNTVLAARQEAGDSVPDNRLEKVAVAVPALPERHPLRQAVTAEPLAPVSAEQEPRPRLAASGNSPSFFASLFRTVDRPSQRTTAPAPTHNWASAPSPASRAVSLNSASPVIAQPLAKPAQPYNSPRWKPASCDGDEQFWK